MRQVNKMINEASMNKQGYFTGDTKNNSTSSKEENSQICFCHGYKLSNIIPDIKVSDNVIQINVGCDDDDTFYCKSNKGGRVQIFIETQESTIYIDLEDVLRFAKKYCYGIFSKVNKE